MAILLALFLIGFCNADDFIPDMWNLQHSINSDRFKIAEAKHAFENHYTLIYHSHSEIGSGAINVPDDHFTPLWDEAVSQDKGPSTFMTVPVATHKLLRIADIRNGKENPQKLAIVKEELHIVKNHEMNMVVITMKTIIPLYGNEFTTIGSSPQNALYIYRLLNGKILNYQLFRNDREEFHTYPGEEPPSYNAKMEEIDRELEGLSIIVSEVYTSTRTNENDVNICGYCEEDHPDTTICDMAIINCAKCWTRVSSSTVHTCPD